MSAGNGRVPGDEHRIGPRVFWLRPGVVAGVAALALGVAFVLDARDDGVSARDVFVAAMLAASGLAGIAGTAIEDVRARGLVLAWTSASLIALGALSLASFGLPLLLAGLIVVPAALQTLERQASIRELMPVLVAMMLGFGAVAAGVLLTR